MFHDEFWKPAYFGINRSDVEVIIKTVPAWVFVLLWVLASSSSCCILFCLSVHVTGNDSDDERSAGPGQQHQHGVEPVAEPTLLRVVAVAPPPHIVVRRRQLPGATAAPVDPVPRPTPLRHVPDRGALERPRRRRRRSGRRPPRQDVGTAAAAVRRQRRQTGRQIGRQHVVAGRLQLWLDPFPQPGTDGRHHVANPLSVHVPHLQRRLLAVLLVRRRTVISTANQTTARARLWINE